MGRDVLSGDKRKAEEVRIKMEVFKGRRQSKQIDLLFSVLGFSPVKDPR